MKKLDRLKYIESNFGQQYVLEYFSCRSLKEILEAIDYFNSKQVQWSLRTDSVSLNFNQSQLSPFIYLGKKEEAISLWNTNGSQLEYIIFKAMPKCYLNGVAKIIDSEMVFFEYNEIEKEIAQRHMYQMPKNLSHLIIGQTRHSSVVYSGWPGPMFLPFDEFVVKRKLNQIYSLVYSIKEKEITFSISYPERKIIIW